MNELLRITWITLKLTKRFALPFTTSLFSSLVCQRPTSCARVILARERQRLALHTAHTAQHIYNRNLH